jgi:hypothetical protein
MKQSTISKNRPARYIRYALGAVVICLTGFSDILPAGDAYRPTTSGNADIKVSGTSNLHDWTMEAKDISCSATFNFLPGNNGEPKSLTTLTLSVPVLQLKSGKSSMDSKAYAALNAKKYSAIVFEMTTATIVPGQKNQFQVKTTGNLSIAGVTKSVTMDVTGTVNANGTITCSGSEKLKMSDFQVKPPVFMLGALKTGDGLTIDFTVIVKS